MICVKSVRGGWSAGASGESVGDLCQISLSEAQLLGSAACCFLLSSRLQLIQLHECEKMQPNSTGRIVTVPR
jgi:hypothetical protein